MKFVTMWSCTPENIKATYARLKERGGDPPPAGVKLLGRYHAIDGGNGFTITETDDVAAVLKWVQAWSDLLSFKVYPVADDEDVAKLLA